MSNLNEGYEELINKYEFDYLLTDKRYKIYEHLKYNKDYIVIYENKKLVLYKKTVN